MYARVSIVVFLTIRLGIRNSLAMCATQTASRMCHWMSWQHLHQPWLEGCNTVSLFLCQPCVAGKVCPSATGQQLIT